MFIKIIFDDTYFDNHTSFDSDVVWLISSSCNDRFATASARADHASRKIIMFEKDENSPTSQLFVKIFNDVQSRFPGWSEIKVHGLEPDPSFLLDVIAPKGEPSGVYVGQLSQGNVNAADKHQFCLTKTIPSSSADRVNIWRDHLPPKGLLTLTDAALGRVAELREHLQSEEPDQSWMPTLSWGKRSTVEPGSGRWRDLADGFTLGFFPEFGNYPLEAVENFNGTDLILRLGFNYDFFRGKKVDYSKKDGGFVLVSSDS